MLLKPCCICYFQVRMKACCILESILRKNDDEHFSIIASYFSENRESIIKCSELPQVSLREKANKVSEYHPPTPTPRLFLFEYSYLFFKAPYHFLVMSILCLVISFAFRQLPISVEIYMFPVILSTILFFYILVFNLKEKG